MKEDLNQFISFMAASTFIVAFIVVMSCFSGCAAVIKGKRDRVPVPVGTKAVMTTGTYDDFDRDGFVEVPRGHGFLKGNSGIVLNDNQETVGLIEPRVNGFFFGNILFGGPVGIGLGVCVDGSTGGMYDLHYRPTL